MVALNKVASAETEARTQRPVLETSGHVQRWDNEDRQRISEGTQHNIRSTQRPGVVANSTPVASAALSPRRYLTISYHAILLESYCYISRVFMSEGMGGDGREIYPRKNLLQRLHSWFETKSRIDSYKKRNIESSQCPIGKSVALAHEDHVCKSRICNIPSPDRCSTLPTTALERSLELLRSPTRPGAYF